MTSGHDHNKQQSTNNERRTTRRQFVKGTLAAGAAAGIGFPTIVPSSVFGKVAAISGLSIARHSMPASGMAKLARMKNSSGAGLSDSTFQKCSTCFGCGP